jgi:hypothetical protein
MTTIQKLENIVEILDGIRKAAKSHQDEEETCVHRLWFFMGGVAVQCAGVCDFLEEVIAELEETTTKPAT